jgi:phage shock protein PspC (stress-responsive transcriptional regulator)
MKKNISINLQGIIFHIEEDGYDILGRYLAEVKAHFAGYRGHEDIVADIEGRIAEIFSARLSPIQQVISLEDVEAMMAKMGRVSDFATEDDEDDAEAPAAAAYATGSTAGASTGPTASGQPRSLYRDMANRKIAGVAAGLAQYFMVNPLWIRLSFLALIFLPRIIFRGIFDYHGNFDLPGLSIIVYVVLWIALPKRYDGVPVTPDTDTPYKKLFRDTDTGKIGGVAAGLAAYSNIDVTLIRVIMLAGLFAGGFTFVVYLILWLVIPEAKTLSEKMRMRGDAITLEGFANNLNSFADEARTAARPIGTFVENSARGLRPLVNFIGSVIRIGAGLLLTVTGFALLIGLAILLGVGLGLIPDSQNIVAGDVPAHILMNGIPAWGLLAGFLAGGIPVVAMFLTGLNLLLRRSLLSRTVSLSLLGLWLLSLVGVAMTVAQQSRDFQYEAEVERVDRFPSLTAPVLFLDARRVDRDFDRVDVDIAAIDSGRTMEVLRTLSAEGPSEAAARATALNSIDYTMRASGDSSLIVDDHLSFLPKAKYRNQRVALTIRLPRDRTFRMSERFSYLLNDDNFVDGREPNDPEQYRYRLRGNKLECIGCTEEQLGEDYRQHDEDRDDHGNIHINVDSDDDDEDSDINLDFGGAPSFNTKLEYYGSDRRTFQESDFTKLHVQGYYRVVVRQGSTFRVEAGGSSSDLKDLRVERNGEELDIRPRRTGSFFRNMSNNDKKVLLVIEMPSLSKITLAGAVRADVSGFQSKDMLAVEQAGASHLRLDGAFSKLSLELAGACRTTASGSADELELDGAGACELAAAKLQTRTADVELAGLSKARLQVTETLKADAAGACVIEYSGNPQNVDADTSGASRVKRLKD